MSGDVFYFYAEDHLAKEKWIGTISKPHSPGKSMINPKILIDSSDEEKAQDDDSDD